MKDDVLKLIEDPELRAMLDRDYLLRLLLLQKRCHLLKSRLHKIEKKLSVSRPEVAGDTETVPMTQMRKIIARRMSESFFGIPTFIQTWEVDMSEMLMLRNRLMGAY